MLKPQNILVSAERVKLTDFGSSVLPEDMYARTRENGGTILYSAPEIVGATLATRDNSARLLSDIYSLGVTVKAITMPAALCIVGVAGAVVVGIVTHISVRWALGGASASCLQRRRGQCARYCVM
jgi:hypothetical protein